MNIKTQNQTNFYKRNLSGSEWENSTLNSSIFRREYFINYYNLVNNLLGSLNTFRKSACLSFIY